MDRVKDKLEDLETTYVIVGRLKETNSFYRYVIKMLGPMCG